MVKLNAKQLRMVRPTTDYSLQQKRKAVSSKRNAIYIILDNVLDTYNVGSIFRLADAVGAKKIYLCGGTETPPNPRIKKASINTTEWVQWEYCETAMEAIEKARALWKCHPERSEGSRDSSPTAQNDKGQVVAVEQSPKSIPYNKFEYKMPLALVVGNETYGVSKEVLEKADAIVELPMYGVNVSLNVMVSLGIVLYKALDFAG